MVKKVVIVGGGFAGAEVAKSLEKDERFSVTLIDSKDYFEFTPSVLRVLVEPKHAKKIQVLHKHYLRNTKVINDKVISVRERDVVLRNEKKVSFDYLVLASGSFYHEPFKGEGVVVSTRAHDLLDFYNKLKSAKSIAVVGGGLVGVEIIGEILDKYNDKEITLVHSRDRVLQRNPKKASDYVEKLFRNKGVNLILGERVKDFTKKILETDKGKKIKADLVFASIGISPHSEMVVKSEFKNLVDDKKFVSVNEFLQLDNHKQGNIFVCGDVTGIKEEKTAHHAELQGKVVVCNIKYLEENKELHKYVGEPKPLVISLGKYNGLFVNGEFVLTGLIPAFMKWFIEKKEMMKYR